MYAMYAPILVSIRFEEQRKMFFETYLLTMVFDAVSTKRKMAIVLHCLAAEGQHVFLHTRIKQMQPW